MAELAHIYHPSLQAVVPLDLKAAPEVLVANNFQAPMAARCTFKGALVVSLGWHSSLFDKNAAPSSSCWASLERAVELQDPSPAFYRRTWMLLLPGQQAVRQDAGAPGWSSWPIGERGWHPRNGCCYPPANGKRLSLSHREKHLVSCSPTAGAPENNQGMQETWCPCLPLGTRHPVPLNRSCLGRCRGGTSQISLLPLQWPELVLSPFFRPGPQK